MLRVDAKTFGNFGVSSALSSLRSLPNGMITACCDHIDSAAGVFVWMIMTMVLDPMPRRELLVVIPSGAAQSMDVDALIAGLESDPVLQLQRKHVPELSPSTGSAVQVIAYDQANVKASRKKLVPIVLDILRSGG